MLDHQGKVFFSLETGLGNAIEVLHVFADWLAISMADILLLYCNGHEKASIRLGSVVKDIRLSKMGDLTHIVALLADGSIVVIDVCIVI